MKVRTATDALRSQNQRKVVQTQMVFEALGKSLATLLPGREMKFWFGTEEEYEAMPNKDATTYYLFTGEWSS